jgi:hypothetical protein
MQVYEPELARAIACEDPLVKIGTDQFEQGVRRLQELLKRPQESNADQVFDLCDSLCESSRELLFRLNRVSGDDLRHIINLFEQASESVDRANATVLQDTEHLKDAAGYLSHIISRITLLKRCLPDTPAQSPPQEPSTR